MRNAKKFLAAALSGLMAVTMAVPAFAEEAVEMDEVQELNLVFSDLATLDVNDVRNANEFQVLSQVQEGLFRVFTDENGNDVIENAGCESYEVSEDGLTYTFHLREMNWSDGVPVVAQHYVDSIKRLLDPELAFSYSFMAYDIVNAEEYYDGKCTVDEIGVRAVDDYTLEIQLDAAIPFFDKKLTCVCFFPIRKDIIDQYGEDWATDYTMQVYNGPFVIDSRILENEMVLVKNENYWDAENVYLDKVTLTEVPEEATQSLLLESQQLDMVTASTDYVAKWQKMTNEGVLVNISKASPSCNYMVFNHHTGGLSGLMNNAKVCKALSLALDREEMNELIYSGINVPAYGLIPANMMVGEQEFRSLAEEPLYADAMQYVNDTEYLQNLFKEGMAEEGMGDDLSSVTLTIISSGNTTQTQAIQEYFKQTWESKLGVTVVTNICPDSSTFVTERNENRYDMVFMGWNGDYNDPMTFMELFNTGSGYAKFMGGYSNETYDELFNALATISDSEVRAENYIQMEYNLVYENAGIAPIYYKNTQIFVQSYVKNLSTPMFGTEFDFSRVYISGKE
ncbi:MAG: peptide ABC transporter substrate-binding protein [Lachnospiraceae bacterium]|nr:peptide ABC transporter substrate-binding protein [Lachnospiraceae bacterium]